MKKLLLAAFAIVGIASASHAAPVSYIQLKNTLQPGATFYVSSGTVRNLTVSTMTVANAFTVSSGTINNFYTSTMTFTVDGSTLTSANPIYSLLNYKRPNLIYVSGTTLTLSTGTHDGSTSAFVLFPDGNLRSDSQSSHILLSAATTASLTGATLAGVRVGTTTVNTWYDVYAVEISTSFVLVADTITCIPQNYAKINNNFGANKWSFIGSARNGDNVSISTGFLNFTQTGNITTFNNNQSAAVQLGEQGPRLTVVSAVGSSTWTYAPGVGAAQVPEHILMGLVGAGSGQNSTTSGWRVESNALCNGTNRIFTGISGVSAISQGVSSIFSPLTLGLCVGSSAGTNGWELWLNGFVDSALGVGSNPLF